MKTLLVATLSDVDAARVLKHPCITKAVLDHGVMFTTRDVPAQSVAVVDVYISAPSNHALALGDDVFHNVADALLN